MSLFRQLLRALEAPVPQHDPDPRLSVAVLLVEAARQDDSFEPRERMVIEQLLARQFDLTHEECLELVEAAERRVAEMVQIHGHTREVFENTTPAERIRLVEMLWEVAYADGVLDPEEDLLIRRIAGLIAVEDRDRVMARQRVAAKLGIKTL
jgi:uncharacterized tellurite resistance protein B-like protein